MLDLNFFNLINQWAGQWFWLDWLGIFFSEYWQYFLAIVILTFLFLGPELEKKKNFWMVMAAVFAGLISRGVLTEFIRFVYWVPRPFVNWPVHQLVSASASEASFPSGHMAFWWAIATVIYFFNKKLGVFLMLASVLMGLARIFVGIHWPSDIFGGVALGVLVGIFTAKFSRKIRTAS